METEIIDDILRWIDIQIKYVKHHSKNKKNSEKLLAYYNGYETSLKETKKAIVKFKKKGAGV